MMIMICAVMTAVSRKIRTMSRHDDRPVAHRQREHVQRADPGGLGRREEPAEDAAEDEDGRAHRAAGPGRRRGEPPAQS